MRREIGQRTSARSLLCFSPSVRNIRPIVSQWIPRAFMSSAKVASNVDTFFSVRDFPSRPEQPTNQKQPAHSSLSGLPQIKSVRCDNQKQVLTVDWGTSTSTDFHYLWLRDNCQCPDCHHPISFQRQVDTQQISQKLYPERIEVLESDRLCICWAQDNVSGPSHKSIFTASWLQSCLRNDLEKYTRKYKRILWDVKAIKPQLPEIEYEVVESSPAGLLKWLDLVHIYGFALVRNAPTTPEDTRRIIEKISHTQSSIFGDFWDFTVYDKSNTSLSHGDTAYTNVCLSPHTDCTYYKEPPGLQFFRILSHTGVGGETQLVDGFNVAERLKKNHNEVYKYLCQTPIHFNYKDSKNSIFSAEKIFQFDEDGDITQIRFNNDDRSPFYIPPGEVGLFYEAMRLMLQEIKDPENLFQFLLKPGDLLVTNNWRILHGRTEFTGDRRLSGAYIRMQDFISKTRVLDRTLQGNTIV